MTFVCKHGHQTTISEKLPPNVHQWSMLFRRLVLSVLLVTVLMGTSGVTTWASESLQQSRHSRESSDQRRTPVNGKSAFFPMGQYGAGTPEGSTVCSIPPLSGSHHKCLSPDGALIANYCEGHHSPKQVHLPHCKRYTLNLVLNASKDCTSALNTVLKQDLEAGNEERGFQSILERFDCRTGYSVNWNCNNCKEAYHEWVCAMHISYFVGVQRVRPCRSFCHQVEQRCPYFHPFVKDQYAGEPTFKCIDRNIPDLPSITTNSAYGLPGQCYDLDLEPPLLPPPTSVPDKDLNSSSVTQPPGAYKSCAHRWTLSLYLLLAVVTSTFCRTLVTLTSGRTLNRTSVDLCR